MRGRPPETGGSDEVVMAKDTVDDCGLCSLASGPGSRSATTLAAGRVLTRPASQNILGNCSRHGSTSHIPVVEF